MTGMISRQSGRSKRPMFTKIRSERIADKVVEQLKGLIADGVFKVGERLPSERELTEKMGVSRTSVREAIQRLEVQGFVDTIHGGGSVVRNITDQQLRAPIEPVLEQDKGRVLELAELRAVMEAWAAREAAKHRTDEELDTIKGYLEAMEKDFERGRTRYELDLKYHTAIAAATHNTIYLHLIDSIYNLIQYSIRVHREEVFVSREDQQTILSHHRKIFDAIARSDPHASEAAMHEHLTFVVAEYTRHFYAGSHDRRRA